MRIRSPIDREDIINTPVVGGDGNIPPIAVAGVDEYVNRGAAATVGGGDSFDPDSNNKLTYEWQQVHGPDVTDKKGKLKGKRALFAAPEDVRSVVLKLVVTDGGDLIGEDTIVVNTLENVDRAYFVDGDNGSDSAGDGSVENPYATIGNALARVNDRQDIYTMNRKSGGYTPDSTLRVPTGTSLYGGYDKNWVRAPFNDKTVIMSRAAARWSSMPSTRTPGSPASNSTGGPGSTSSTAIGLYARGGGATLYVLHNHIVAGNGAAGSVVGTAGLERRCRCACDSVRPRLQQPIRAGLGGRAADRPALRQPRGLRRQRRQWQRCFRRRRRWPPRGESRRCAATAAMPGPGSARTVRAGITAAVVAADEVVPAISTTLRTPAVGEVAAPVATVARAVAVKAASSPSACRRSCEPRLARLAATAWAAAAVAAERPILTASTAAVAAAAVPVVMLAPAVSAPTTVARRSVWP